MVVCPTCREVNEEGRAICQKCGSSLAPDAVALLPRREHGERAVRAVHQRFGLDGATLDEEA